MTAPSDSQADAPAPVCKTCGEIAIRGGSCRNPFHVTGDPAWDMHGTPGMGFAASALSAVTP